MVKLAEKYPVASSWEFQLVSDEVVSGRIYCTDEATQTIVLQTDLTYTTLASELRLINSSAVSRSTSRPGDTASTLGAFPLPKVQKKTLEEREKKAIRMAEASLRNINQKVCLPFALVVRIFCAWRHHTYLRCFIVPNFCRHHQLVRQFLTSY